MPRAARTAGRAGRFSAGRAAGTRCRRERRLRTFSSALWRAAAASSFDERSASIVRCAQQAEGFEGKAYRIAVVCRRRDAAEALTTAFSV